MNFLNTVESCNLFMLCIYVFHKILWINNYLEIIMVMNSVLLEVGTWILHIMFFLISFSNITQFSVNHSPSFNAGPHCFGCVMSFVIPKICTPPTFIFQFIMSTVAFYRKQISLKVNTQRCRYEDQIPVQYRNKQPTNSPTFSYSCQNLSVILVDAPSESTVRLRTWTVTFHWLIGNHKIHCKILQRATG
jgi:hypothetical protein